MSSKKWHVGLQMKKNTFCWKVLFEMTSKMVHRGCVSHWKQGIFTEWDRIISNFKEQCRKLNVFPIIYNPFKKPRRVAFIFKKKNKGYVDWPSVVSFSTTSLFYVRPLGEKQNVKKILAPFTALLQCQSPHSRHPQSPCPCASWCCQNLL